jgi:hypothetical protein
MPRMRVGVSMLGLVWQKVSKRAWSLIFPPNSDGPRVVAGFSGLSIPQSANSGDWTGFHQVFATAWSLSTVEIRAFSPLLLGFCMTEHSCLQSFQQKTVTHV